MLRRLLHDFALPARLLADGDERRLTNLLHLAELLQTAAAEHEGEQALVRWLAEQRAGTGDDSGEAQILRLESDAGLVRVVTIHKAKGLEYPLVFLPFVCDFRRVGADHLPLRYHDDQGHLQFSLEPDKTVVERADAERLAEDLRLLYVAVTRARHACWLGIAPLRKGQGKNRTDLQNTAIGHLLTGGEAIEPVGVWQRMKDITREDAGVRVAAAPVDEPRPLPAVSERVEPLAPARAYRGPGPERWWIASYSALRPAEHELPGREPQQAGDEIIADEVEAATAADRAHAPTSGVHGFVRGAMAGTFLHGLLEKAAQSGFGASADGTLQSAIASRCRARGWSAWAGTVEQWLTDFLRTPLPFGDTTIQLDTLEAGRYRAELEFLLPAHRVDTAALDALVSAHVLPGEPRPPLDREALNGMLKGFIDLVVESGGRYSIADYKSNWLGPDDSAYTAPAMNSTILAKRQDVQYSLYLLALHRQLRARLGEAYAPQTHLGGAAVLFLRGLYAPSRGVHFQTADPALLTRLDALFAGTSDHAA